uniref:Uncharacterized protein n=1 Tax=Panagrolaimus sp. JU765 TaxID=591449 RepID=A0AC34QNA6_9BILA
MIKAILQLTRIRIFQKQKCPLILQKPKPRINDVRHDASRGVRRDVRRVWDDVRVRVPWNIPRVLWVESPKLTRDERRDVRVRVRDRGHHDARRGGRRDVH